jgi:hypothetical protein
MLSEFFRGYSLRDDKGQNQGESVTRLVSNATPFGEQVIVPTQHSKDLIAFL